MSFQNDDFLSTELKREQNGEYVTLSSYVASTFLWMFAGLMVTFGIAATGSYSNLLFILMNRFTYLPIVLLVLELVVVFVLASRIQKMSVNTARVLFFVYAALNGMFFSTYFLLFEVQTLILVFGITALFFGSMSLYGFVTKKDLTRLKPILLGGLVFLMVFGILSFFLNLSGFDTIICFIGIIVFLGLTAYDTQKIKMLHAEYATNPDMSKKASIFAALQLYLDFINLFIYLLRILGRKKN